MKEENNKNTSLVPKESQGIIRLGNLMAITDKILEEQRDRSYLLTWDFLIEYSLFFNYYFSTIYPFSENELIDYYNSLELGSKFISPAVDLEPLDVGRAHYGLKYNRDIVWSESLKKLYSSKEREFLDFYYISVKDFDQLPLDIKEQVDLHKDFKYEQKIYFRRSYEIDSDIEKFYDDIFYKKEFTNLEILDIVKFRETDYFCNNYFVNQLDKKIKEDIPDFEIFKFYSILKGF